MIAGRGRGEEDGGGRRAEIGGKEGRTGREREMENRKMIERGMTKTRREEQKRKRKGE